MKIRPDCRHNQRSGEAAAVMEMLDLNSLRVRRFEFEPRMSYAVVGG